MTYKPPQPEPAGDIADAWAQWCGENQWTKRLREFGNLGGKVKWWCGYPQSHSAIPLTFSLIMPDGTPFPCAYRLKDIRAAIDKATEE